MYEAELNDKKDVVEWVLKEGGEGLESGVAGEGGEGEADEASDENGPHEESASRDHEMSEGGAMVGKESTKLEKKLGEMGV